MKKYRVEIRYYDTILANPDVKEVFYRNTEERAQEEARSRIQTRTKGNALTLTSVTIQEFAHVRDIPFQP